MLKLEPGQLFQGKYRIDEEIGAGGMGVVYLATQMDINRQVALKLIRAEQLGSQDNLERFVREFRALSTLSHENIVVVYSQGIDPHGLPYAVCEYIKGQNLQAILNEEGRLPWLRAAGIVAQIASALAHVHSQGIVHRDLKPGNIMLSNKPQADFVKIIDFGLAHIQNKADLERLTQSGLLLGSVNYMSPEQCKAMPLDARSDIYSLGCVFFEMLSGEKLFDTGNPISVIYQHCNEPPDERLKILNGLAPQRLIELLRNMLEKSLEKRTANMNEVANVLQELIQDPPEAKSTPLPRNKQASKATLAMIAAAALITLFAGTSIILGAKRIAPPGESLAPTQKKRDRLRIRRNYDSYEKDVTNAFGFSGGDRKAALLAWNQKYGHDKSVPVLQRAQAACDLRMLEKEDDEHVFPFSECMSLSSQLGTKIPNERKCKTMLQMSAVEDLIRAGKRSEAEKLISTALNNFDIIHSTEGDKLSLEKVCEAYLTIGDGQKSMEILRKLMELSPDIYLRRLACDASILKGDLKQALQYNEYVFKKAFAMEPYETFRSSSILQNDLAGPGAERVERKFDNLTFNTLCQTSEAFLYLNKQRAKETLEICVKRYMEEKQRGTLKNDFEAYWLRPAVEAKLLGMDALHKKCMKLNVENRKKDYLSELMPNKYYVGGDVLMCLIEANEFDQAIDFFQENIKLLDEKIQKEEVTTDCIRMAVLCWKNRPAFSHALYEATKKHLTELPNLVNGRLLFYLSQIAEFEGDKQLSASYYKRASKKLQDEVCISNSWGDFPELERLNHYKLIDDALKQIPANKLTGKYYAQLCLNMAQKEFAAGKRAEAHLRFQEAYRAFLALALRDTWALITSKAGMLASKSGS